MYVKIVCPLTFFFLHFFMFTPVFVNVGVDTHRLELEAFFLCQQSSAEFKLDNVANKQSE